MTFSEEAVVVYMAAANRGDPPTKAVEDHFALGRATTGRLIRSLRDSGLLPPTEPGMSPQMNKRAVAVAAALGIPTEKLVTAVRDHAAGSLRVSSKPKPTDPPERPCAQCKTPFVWQDGPSKRPRRDALYCSRRCVQKAAAARA